MEPMSTEAELEKFRAWREKVVVDDAVLQLIGKTREEVAKMTLGEFHALVCAHGYTVEVSWREAESGNGNGRLRVKMAEE
jgi:hypothetical protein